jgi:hypothetical protein
MLAGIPSALSCLFFKMKGIGMTRYYEVNNFAFFAVKMYLYFIFKLLNPHDLIS